MRTDGSDWMVAARGTQWQCSDCLKKKESKWQGFGDWKWSCQEIKCWQRCFASMWKDTPGISLSLFLLICR